MPNKIRFRVALLDGTHDPAVEVDRCEMTFERFDTVSYSNNHAVDLVFSKPCCVSQIAILSAADDSRLMVGPLSPALAIDPGMSLTLQEGGIEIVLKGSHGYAEIFCQLAGLSDPEAEPEIEPIPEKTRLEETLAILRDLND